jgi:hypothetical protein
MSLGIDPKNDLRRGSPEVKSGFFLSGAENAKFCVSRRCFNADDDRWGLSSIADADAWWNAVSIALPLHGCN